MPTTRPRRPTRESISSLWVESTQGRYGNAPSYNGRTVEEFLREYSGYTTPNYRAFKAGEVKGETLKSLPYSMKVERSKYVWCNMNTQHHDWPFGATKTRTCSVAYTGGGFPLDEFGSDAVTDVKNKALQRFNEKLQDANMNLLQSFAERYQAVDMIANTAHRVAAAAWHLRRADFKGVVDSLNLVSRDGVTPGAKAFERVKRTPAKDRLSHHWLEWEFGWRPLLKDIRDGAELLAESIATYKEPHGVISASARARNVEITRNGSGPAIQVKTKFTGHFGCSLKAKYRLDDERRYALSKTGISNPMLLSWELLPYSFVVDWFLPVGNYLSSLTAQDGFVIYDAHMSVLEKGTTVKTVSVDHSDSWGTSTGGSEGPEVRTCARFTRTTSLPTFELQFQNPLQSRPLERLTSSVALIVNLFSKNRRDFGSHG